MTHAPVDAARIREVGRIIYDEWNKSRGPGVAELCILWAEKTAAKILDAQGTAPEGHDEPCAFCGKPCSSLAGDPSQWPLGFAHPDGTGVCKWHHVGCVVERLFPAQGAVDTPALVAAYTNWRGETELRRIVPLSVRYGSSEWHPKPQWLLRAKDVDKGEEREFAFGGFLDAQGAAPAGWRRGLVEHDGMWTWVDTHSSPALHAPTVEACALVAEGFDAAVNSKAMEPFAHDPKLVSAVVQRDFAIADAILALTSGAEAGASAEPPIRPNDDPPEQVRAREEAERRHPHPLSEWRDEELFRAAPFSFESPRWEETDGGWRPWHGSDKAPVKGSVEVRLRNGGRLNARPARELRWKHHREFQQPDYPRDIIAYRPVPAKAERPYEACCGAYKYHGTKCERCPVKAEPTARFCWNCGTFQTDPRCNVCGVGVDERAEPAADAGEVERLWSLAQGIEKSLETCGHVTLDNAEWAMVCAALRVAALRPAPTEEPVERAADIATAVLAEELGNVGQAERLGQSVASAILAAQPAPQESK
jgi:hypothetical protein